MSQIRSTSATHVDRPAGQPFPQDAVSQMSVSPRVSQKAVSQSPATGIYAREHGLQHGGKAPPARRVIACISHESGAVVSENALNGINTTGRDWVSINRGQIVQIPSHRPE